MLKLQASLRAPGDHARVSRFTAPGGGHGWGGLTLAPARRQAFMCDGYRALRFDLDAPGARPMSREVADYPTLGVAALAGPDHVVAFHGDESGGALHRWSLDTLTHKRLWRTSGQVVALAASASGDLIAFASEQQVRWGAPDATRTIALAHTKHDPPPRALAVTPDGAHLIVGAASGPLRVVAWREVEPRVVARLAIDDEDEPFEVSSLRFTADGSRLVVAGFIREFEPAIVVLDVKELSDPRRVARMEREMPGPHGVTGPYRVALSRDQTRVYGVERGEQLSAWELATGRWLGSLTIAHAPMALEVLSFDGVERVVLGDEVEGLCVWNIDALDTTPKTRLRFARGDHAGLALTGDTVIAADAGELYLWQGGDALERVAIPTKKGASWAPSPSFALAGSRLVVWNEARDPYDDEHPHDGVDRRVRVFDLATRRFTLVPDLGPVRHVAVNATTAAAMDARGLHTFALAAPERLTTLSTPAAHIRFYDDTLVWVGPQALALCGSDGLRVVDATTGAVRWRGRAATSAVVSPDGGYVAALADDGVVIHDGADGRQLCRLVTLDSDRSVVQPEAVVFVDGGVIVRDGERRVTVFDLPSGVRRFAREHADDLGGYELVAVPGRGHAIGASSDGVVHAWDLTSGEIHLAFAHADGPVDTLVVSPDGATIALAGAHGQLARFTWDASALRRPSYAPTGATPATSSEAAAGSELAKALSSLRDGTARATERTKAPPLLAELGDAGDDEEVLLKKAEKALAKAWPPEGAPITAVDVERAWRLGEAILDEVVLDDALLKRSQRWLERAAAAGHLDAKHRLGVELVDGMDYRANTKKGRALLSEAAAADHRESLHWEGTERVDERAEHDGDDRGGLEMVARAANLGESLGWAALGRYLEEGVIGGAPDLEQARRAYTLGSDVAYAAANLAVMWRDGLGGPADASEAARFHKASVELDYDWATDGRWSTKRGGRRT